MRVSKKKALEISILVTLLCGSPFIGEAIEPLKTQADVDTTINTPLESGDVNLSWDNATDRVYNFSQIRADGTVTVQGDAGATKTLTLDAKNTLRNPRPETTDPKTSSNVEALGAGNDLTFLNLDTLEMNGDGMLAATGSQWSANIYAENGGTVTVDSTVKNFEAKTTMSVGGGDETNIYARNGGTINIYSPHVTIEDKRGQNAHFIEARGDNSAVNVGRREQELYSVDLRAGSDTDLGLYGLAALADGSNDAASTTKVSVFSRNLSISDMVNSIYAQGIAGKMQKQALVQVGSADHPIDTININYAVEAGLGANNNGQVDLQGRKVNINQTRYGISAKNGGKISVNAGSSLSITSARRGAGSQSTGILAGNGNNSQVDIHGRNVTIRDFNYGIRLDGTDANPGGTVNLGTAASPLNNVKISDLRPDGVGISSGSAGMGAVNVHAASFNANSRVATPISINHGTEVNIHTSQAAALSGTSGNAVVNHGGNVAINTNSSDGSTSVRGIVDTDGNTGKTNIEFHTNNSSFNGNAFDGDGDGSQTKITVSNGGIWNLNTGVTKSRGGKNVNTFIDTLDVSNGGTVNFGGTPPSPLTRSRGGPYTNSVVRNFTGTGGTLSFRTDLEESATDHTVNGHSDQLTITGTSTGTHDIMVYDHSQGGSARVNGGYVLLVHDESAAPGAVFRGSANLQNGGLFARPAEITNEAPAAALGYTDVPTTGTNWYLRMEGENNISPVAPIQTMNAKNNISFARSRYGALWIEQETLRERLGELRDHKQDDGIWARITRGEYSMNGVSGNADYTMYHIGYDKQIGSQKGQKQYIGAAYHHTDTDLNYRHFTDDSDMDADIGTIYYTNLGDKGHYLDIVGKFGRMKGKMKTFGEFPESGKWDSPFYSLSAEYGRKINYENGWYWEPQAQLTYSHLGSDNYLTNQGTHAHLDSLNSLVFRTGFTVGKKNGQNEYYGKVFWHHEFEGSSDAYFFDKNGDHLHDSYDFGSSWVTVGFGGQVAISKDTYLYGDVEKSFGGDVKKKWDWNIGVRFGF